MFNSKMGALDQQQHQQGSRASELPHQMEASGVPLPPEESTTTIHLYQLTDGQLIELDLLGEEDKQTSSDDSEDEEDEVHEETGFRRREASMEESEESMNSVEWNKLLHEHYVDGHYLYGYVTNEDSVSTVLELHKRVTTTTFSVRNSSSLQYNPTKVDKDKFKFSPRSIFYSKSVSPYIPDDGVPFLFGGSKVLECQFGPVKIRQAHGFDQDYAHRKDTRKMGCEAKITIKQICRFPHYAVTSQKNRCREQKRMKENLLEDMREGREIDFVNRYYMELPLNEAHTKHKIGAGLSGQAQRIHPTLTQWIEQLVGEGVTRSREVQATLRHLVKTRMSDTAAPSELDRAYYPRIKDIKNHIYLSKCRLRVAKRKQEKFHQKRPLPYQKENPSAGSAEDCPLPPVEMDLAQNESGDAISRTKCCCWADCTHMKNQIQWLK